MGIKQLHDGGPDGIRIGQASTDKIAFFALSTPIARPSVTWPNTTTASTAINENKVNRLKNALVALGLIVTT
jgi:hypothetical protein